MKPQQTIFLDGKRIYLRATEAQDLEQYQRWVNDPLLRQFIYRQIPLDAIEEKTWYETRSRGLTPTDITFAIIRKKDNRLIGNTGIHRIDWLSRHAITGALIGEADCQNRGYGSEAKKLILQYCFDTLGLHRICADVLATNPRSLAYLGKNGYRVEGRQREQVYRNGAWVDLILLGILDREWRAAQQKQKK